MPRSTMFLVGYTITFKPLQKHKQHFNQKKKKIANDANDTDIGYISPTVMS